MRAVFLDHQTFSPTIDLSALKAQFTEFTLYPITPPENVVSRCHGYDVVITNKVLLDKAILSQLPSLKLICVAATGTNNIDLKAAHSQQITVTNAAGYAGASVAQYILSQLLDYFQNISHHNQNTEQGLWQQSETFCYLGNPINELAGKTLGVVGVGHIAQKLIHIAHAFDMKVLLSEHKGQTQLREGRTPFEEVLAQADIISLHCPLTEQSHHLINAETLSLMKPSALLVNTARGAIVDSSALIVALKNNIIAGAILDVIDQEPPPKNHQLLNQQIPNLKVTAHIAWASQQAQQRLIDIIISNVIAFKQGEPINQVL